MKSSFPFPETPFTIENPLSHPLRRLCNPKSPFPSTQISLPSRILYDSMRKHSVYVMITIKDIPHQERAQTNLQRFFASRDYPQNFHLNHFLPFIFTI